MLLHLIDNSVGYLTWVENRKTTEAELGPEHFKALSSRPYLPEEFMGRVDALPMRLEAHRVMIDESSEGVHLAGPAFASSIGRLPWPKPHSDTVVCFFGKAMQSINAS